MKQAAFQLVVPDRAYLAGFAGALAQGWSPSTSTDVSSMFLAAIQADADAFLADLISCDGVVVQPDGTTRPKLPQLIRWMWDGEFAGSINLRWQNGTDELPPHILGHVGYAVVPWKRRAGYATQSLRMMMDEARLVGLNVIQVTTDVGNDTSRRVIERCNGVYLETFNAPFGGVAKLRYRIDLTT